MPNSDYGRSELTRARRDFNETIDKLIEAVSRRRRLDAEAQAATTADDAKLKEQFPAMKGRS